MAQQGLAARRDGLPARIVRWLDGLPIAVAEIFMRAGPALVFWRSGQQKLASWDTTVMLFKEEYRVPLLPPEFAACLATGVEHVAPIMLVLGLGARLGAAAMLAMTMTIQLFVYPESYPSHILWAGPLLYILLRGPGMLSVDHAIRRRWM
jgi:putative oxidoreductase